MINCKSKKYALDVAVYETSAAGNALTKVDKFSSDKNLVKVTINPNEKFQTITGFGGAFVTSFSTKHGVELGAKKLMEYLASPAGALAYAKATGRPAVNSAVASKVSADAAAFGKAGASNGIVQENALLGSNAGGANWYDVLADVYSKVLVKGQDVSLTLDTAAIILGKNFVAGMKNR